MPLSGRAAQLAFIPIPLLSAAILCLAQGRGPNLGPSGGAPNAGPATIVVRVEAPDGTPFQGSADVMLSQSGGMEGMHQTTRNAGQAEFPQLAVGVYYVLVTADGYKPAQDEVTVGNGGSDSQAWVRLEPLHAVTPAVSDLIGAAVAPKIEKDLSKGLEALQAGKWDAAQSQFETVYKRSPEDAAVNYLLGYTFLQRGSTVNAERYLLRAASIDPQYAAAFAALGQLRLKQDDLADAAVMFERAVSLDAQNWSARWSLAATYMKQREYEKARAEAEAAVKAGKGAAVGAEFIVGEALAALGDRANAIAALESFLRDSPGNSSAPAAQTLIVKLKSEEGAAQKDAEEIRALAKAGLAKPASSPNARASAVTGPSFADADVNSALPVWAPPGVDETKPAVAPGTACSLQQVLEKAGANIQNLVADISNINATEQMSYEELNELGKPLQTAKRQYDYLANFEEIRPGNLTMNEVRNGNPTPDVFPGNIVPSGFTSMALVFHPYIRGDFQMTCEGLGDWRGHPTWIVYFRQRDGVLGRVSGYSINGALHRLSLKGRAWITSDSFQVAHIETDMVTPMPEIRLMLQHMSVDYSPVEFRAQGKDVWLPSTADLYFEFRKQRLHSRDTFSRYKLFAVGASQKIHQPPAAPPPDPRNPDQ